MENISLLDLLGLAGVLGYLSSYAMVQLKTEFADKLIYSALNFFSALLVMISLMENFNLSSMLIQLSWISISSFGIYRCLHYKFYSIHSTPIQSNPIKQWVNRNMC